MKVRHCAKILGTSLAVACVAACTSRGPAPGTGERVAFLAGASGEKIEPNFFVQDLQSLHMELKARGWSIRSAVGAKPGEIPGSVPATNDRISEGLKKTLESAKPGGQALIVFHSHGREREARWGQRSHSIVSEDRDPNGADIGFDLDSIEPELVKAQARGVKVALLDLTCYSGATLALRGSSCTVTLASPGYVSLCSGRPEERTFNSYFLKLPDTPETPVSLEKQFLWARMADGRSINLPQISSRKTPAVDEWDRFLVSVDPIDTFEDLRNMRAGAKEYDAQALAEALGDSPLKDEISGRLRQVLEIRRRIEAEIPKLAKLYDEAELKVELPERAPLLWSPATLFEALTAAKEGRVPEGYSHVQRAVLQLVAAKSSELGSRHEKALMEYQAAQDHYDRLGEELAVATGDLFESERKLYDQEAVPTGASGCRDFAL